MVRGTPSAIASSTSAHTGSIHASASSARPASTTHLASCLRCWTATRAAALPHAAGSRSRGKTKSVRRMASCLTRARSSYSAASTSATLTPGTRAHSARCTVAASVACRTVIARVALTTSGRPPDRPCRRASRAWRSRSSMWRTRTSCQSAPTGNRDSPRLLAVSNPYGNDPYGQQPQNPYGAPGAGAPQFGGPGDGQPPKTDAVSIVALVLSFCCSPVSLVLGIVGIVRTKGGQRKGRWAAIVALVLSILGARRSASSPSPRAASSSSSIVDARGRRGRPVRQHRRGRRHRVPPRGGVQRGARRRDRRRRQGDRREPRAGRDR